LGDPENTHDISRISLRAKNIIFVLKELRMIVEKSKS